MSCKHCGKPLGWSPHAPPYHARPSNHAMDAHADCDGAAKWEAAKAAAKEKHGDLACGFCGIAFWETPNRGPVDGMHADCGDAYRARKILEAG